MQWKIFAATLLAAGHASAQGMVPMMRFPCSQLVIDRIDPLVNPGSVPSPHLHQIVGGNSFNASMSHPDHDLPSGSTCTTCMFKEDLSNYWTAVLFFRARNGSFKRVPQRQEEGLSGNGGITIYYIPAANAQKKVTAFKPGFRMLVGDAGLRTQGASRKICHRCMPASGDNRNLNCASPDAQTLPTKPCVGGIRSIITFPTCWDGKNLDSPNHQSHVAYATGAGANDVGPTGTCPSTHPIVIPQLMYEIRWRTDLFKDPALWPEDTTKQPFVWSTGDSRGFSQHGDYVFGWKDDSLQRAMDARCNDRTCSVLTSQSVAESDKCNVAQRAKSEEPQGYDGWLTSLPGSVVVF